MVFNWLSRLRDRMEFRSRFRLKAARKSKVFPRIHSNSTSVVELLEPKRLLTAVLSNIEAVQAPYTVNSNSRTSVFC